MRTIINIDEDKIAECVEHEIIRQIIEQTPSEHGYTQRAIREGIEKGVKEYIYANKEEIIERVKYELDFKKEEEGSAGSNIIMSGG